MGRLESGSVQLQSPGSLKVPFLLRTTPHPTTFPEPVSRPPAHLRVSVLVLCCQQVALSRQERARVRRDAVVK